MSIPLISASIKPGADGTLYIGVGEYLFSTGKYLDVVRCDEILPSVGHVIYATIIGKLGPLVPFLVAFASFSVAMSAIVPRSKAQQLLAIILSVLLSGFASRHLTVGGVESSLIFSTSLFIASTTIYITSPTRASIVVWGLSLFWLLLVRPVYYPILIPIVVSAGAYAYWNGMRVWSSLSVIPMTLWVGVWAISSFAYGDSRLVTGTYSAIPLYSGFNSHINLRRDYGSKLWQGTDAEIGLKPIENRDGWKKRDERLKNLVVEFVVNNPAEAIGAYTFRLKRFFVPFGREPLYASFMIATWFGSFFLVFFRSRRYSSRWALAALVAFGFNIAWAIASALFVYAGSRYLVANYTMTTLVLSLQFRAIGTYQIICRN